MNNQISKAILGVLQSENKEQVSIGLYEHFLKIWPIYRTEVNKNK